MGLIEQAARRLEELRRAGVEIPEVPGGWPKAAQVRPSTTRAAPQQPPAWWVDTVPNELADELESQAEGRGEAVGSAVNGHTVNGSHGFNGTRGQSNGRLNGAGMNGHAGHAGHPGHQDHPGASASPFDAAEMADAVMEVMPSTRRSMTNRRAAAVDVHEDALPDRPIDTDVATEAESPAHAIMVRDERSTRVGMDVLRMARDGYLVPGTAHGAVAEEFRGIKRALLRSIGEAAQLRVRRPNLVMVTSARPKEGKTFVALNLALSIAAEVDHSALLVDLDSVQSAVMTRTGLPPDQPGVIDLLTQAGRLPVSQVMLSTQIPKLSLLPAGTANSHASELLSSVAMDALLDDLARRYRDRVVIFDAPPLLGATEVAMLASQMGQVLVVVSQEQTPLEDVKRAFDKVVDCPRVMSVFNRSATLSVAHGRSKAEAAHA